MKDNSSFKYFLIVAGVVLIFIFARGLFSGQSSNAKGNKSAASKYYAAGENESADYYRGFMDAVEMFRSDSSVLEGSNAYYDIWETGFEFGYEEGINGVEY